ncbi:hypothetical protein CL634_10900 [bacterium]|nr:hypothetical protein [bacterium]
MPIITEAKATNEQTALETYVFRKLYKEEIYPEFGPRFIDYWYDKAFYGRINRREEIVVPKTTALKQIRSDSGTHMAINFVADAFDGLRRALQNGILRGVIESGASVYTVLKPKAAWTSGDNSYLIYLGILDEIFIETFLAEGQRFQKIKSFNDYLKYYILYLNKMIDNSMPITKSGFVISKYCSPMISGLNIELNKENHGIDSKKQKIFIQDLNFEVFRDTAAKFGFVVDKNAPWRLTAELASPRMQLFAQNYGLTYEPGSASNIFESYYDKTYRQDIDSLMSFFLFSYESFIEAYPISKELKISKCNNKAYIERLARKHMRGTTYAIHYGDAYWLKLYFKLRLKENGISLFPPKLKIHLRQIEDFNKMWSVPREDVEWSNKMANISETINQRILDLSSERWWIKTITKKEKFDILGSVSDAGNDVY